MRAKSVVLLVLALGCGLIASIGISQVMDKNRQAGPVEEAETVQVYVAKKELPAGEPLKAEHLKIQKWPKEMSEDAVLKLEEIVGQRPGVVVFPNDLITTKRLKAADAASTTLPPGFRLVWVKMSAEKGGNLVKVGDKVDVQVYLRQGAAPEVTSPTTRTFLNSIKVFAVNTNFKEAGGEGENAGASASVIGLQVTPEQAQKVTLAQQVGQVAIVLRNAGDTAEVKDDPVTMASLLRGGEPKKVKPTQTASKEGGFGDWIKKQMELAAKEAKKTPPPVKEPVRKDQFVMLALVGADLQNFTFNDPKKPPMELNNSGAGMAAIQAHFGAHDGTSRINLNAVSPDGKMPEIKLPDGIKLPPDLKIPGWKSGAGKQPAITPPTTETTTDKTADVESEVSKLLRGAPLDTTPKDAGPEGGAAASDAEADPAATQSAPAENIGPEENS